MSLGGFNKKFEPSETTRDWVTSDKELRRKNLEDPLLMFRFTHAG